MKLRDADMTRVRVFRNAASSRCWCGMCFAAQKMCTGYGQQLHSACRAHIHAAKKIGKNSVSWCTTLKGFRIFKIGSDLKEIRPREAESSAVSSPEDEQCILFFR